MARIIGTGHYCPSNEVHNEMFTNLIETSSEWIEKRTGILKRNISTGENTSELAAKAAISAINSSECNVKDIGLIVTATITPDSLMPSTACRVQEKIGCNYAAAFDVNAACSGFVYALAIADSMMEKMNINKSIVIGAEVLSKIINWQDRSTCILFGDGAGAVVLDKDNNEKGIIATVLGADGEKGIDCLNAKAISVNNPYCKANEDKETQYITMDGKAVFKFAVNIIPKIVDELIDKANIDISEVKYIVPHQANYRIIKEAAKKLEISEDRFYLNLSNYGNTSAASIPIALSEMNEKGLINKGDKIILASFGAGLTWAGALIEM